MASTTVQPAIKGPAPVSTRTLLLKWLIPVGLAVLVLIIPRPVGLTPQAWHFLAVFVAVIAALISEPLPGPAIGVMGISLAAALVLVGNTPAESMRWALSGFSNDTVWLVFSATLFALGYEVTGLGRRIALMLVRSLGKKTLGLGYAVALADLILAPFTSSNTARSGGTIYPIVKNIPPLYGSSPTENPRKIGAYLFWTAFAAQCVTSSMFLTALAPNVLAVEMSKKIAHVEISWTNWMVGFLPVGILLFAITPLLTYYLYPPELKEGEKVALWAGSQLKEMGPVTRREKTMAVLALMALIAWIGAGKWIAAVTVALCVISLMILTGVINWKDISSNKSGWNALVWLATLVAMADGLNRVGFLAWFAKRSAVVLGHLPMIPMVVGLIAIFYLVHYFFASLSAHTTAVLPVFLAVIVGVSGIPLRPVTMVIGYSLGLMGVLTPYATGPAPIWYSPGYITSKEFWRMGFITGMLYLIVLLGIGLPFALKVMR